MSTPFPSTGADAPPVRSTPLPAAAPASPARLPIQYRAIALMVSGSCLAVLMVGSSLSPNPEGHGTHSQLGLGPCGWLVASGSPCPTCGMTTAFAHVCHGEFISAFRVQPMGMLIAVGCAAAFWIGLHAAITGSRLPLIAAKLLQPKALWIITGLWAASWVYVLLTWKHA